MKLSPKQQNEISVWEYFIPQNCQWLEKTDDDIKKFFEWSEQGKHKNDLEIPMYKKEGRTYFHALVWGKKWANIHIHELWEPDIGTTIGYIELVDEMPRVVIDFIKKEIFKGADSEVIEKSYEIYN